jgi:hypothetical protein
MEHSPTRAVDVRRVGERGGCERAIRARVLEQQALAGILAALDREASDAQRRYALPAGHDEVLLDRAA